MATERVDIVVSERGSRVVRRNLEEIGTTARSSGVGVDILNRALALIGGTAIVTKLMRLTDAFTSMINRLAAITGSVGQANTAFDRLADIATRSRTSLDATVTLYQRVAAAAGDLGASQDELFTFVESVGKALATQGGSAESARGALIQLSQAMGASIVRAEEFNSIMEGAYPIAQAAARGLDAAGGSVSRLRQLVVAGKVSSEDFFNAILSQSAAIEEAFGKTVPTVGQAFEVLNTQLTSYVGRINQSYTVTSTLSTLIISAATNLDKLAGAFIVAGTAALIFAGAKGLGAVQKALIAINALILRNPIGFLVTAITTAIVAYGQFGVVSDDFVRKNDLMITAVDKLVATFEGAKAYIEEAWANLPQFLANIAVRAVNQMIAAFEWGVNKIGDVIGKLTGVDNQQVFLGRIEVPFQEAGNTAANAFMLAYQNTLRTLSDRNKSVYSPLTETSGSGAPAMVDEKAMRALQRLQRELQQVVDAIDPVQGAVMQLTEDQLTLDRALQKNLITLEQYDSYMEKLAYYYRDQLDPLGALIRGYNEQAQALQLEVGARERLVQIYQIQDQLGRQLSDTERADLDNRLRRLQQLELEATLMDQINGPVDDYNAKLAALSALQERGAITGAQFEKQIRQLRIAVLDLDTSFEGGLERGLLKIQEQFTDIGSLVDQTLTRAFQGAEDALVQFVTTGKISISDLANSIQADLARIAVRQSITGPLAQLLGLNAGSITGAAGGVGGLTSGGGLLGSLFGSSGGGSWLSSIGSALGSLLPGFQHGGNFTVGGSGGIDSQLVAFRATPGEQVEISKPGQGGYGGAPNINMTVVTPDANSFRKSQGQIMAELGANVSRAVSRNGV